MIMQGTFGIEQAMEPAHAADADTAPLAQLTPTQLKVLHGVHSGLLNKQIAFDLGIAEATVKAHMTALMRKLNVRNRTQAAIAAQALTMRGSTGFITAHG